MTESLKSLLKQIVDLFSRKKEMVEVNLEETKNKDLVAALLKLAKDPTLEKTLYTPVSKIFLMNVYVGNFNDLLSNLQFQSNSTSLLSVNVDSYFKPHKGKLNHTFERIAAYAVQNKLPLKTEFDLFQICETIESLKGKDVERN